MTTSSTSATSTGSLGQIQVGGIISGLDTSSIVSQLMAIDQQPITLLQSRQDAYTVQLTAYGVLENKLSTLNNAIEGLSNTSDFDVYSATSSDDTIFTGSASSSATPGTYDISVSQLAKAQKLTSTGFGASEAVGAGTLHIETGGTVTIDSTNDKIDFKENTGSGLGSQLTATIPDGTYTTKEFEAAVQSALDSASAAGGNSINYSVSYDAANQKFSIGESGSSLSELQLLWSSGTDAATSAASTLGFATSDDTGAASYTADNTTGSVTDVTVGATDTIQDVANSINSANAGVTAKVIYDGTDYYLSLVGGNTGDKNAFNITATDSDGNNTDTSGLSRLVYDAGVTENMTQVQGAKDAILSVDGVNNITRSSNTVSDVITGVTLNLNQAASGQSETLTVAPDTTTMASNITSVVTAYNDLLDFFSQYQQQPTISGTSSSSSTTSSGGGTLFGDTTTNLIKNSLQREMTQSIPGTGTVTSLADLGITLTQSDSPRLQVDTSTLSSALSSHYQDVESFFTQAADGFAVQINDTLNGYLNQTSGSLIARENGITTATKTLQNKIDDMTTRNTAIEANLWKQFNALEVTLAGYQTTGNYLTQQITAMQNFSSKG